MVTTSDGSEYKNEDQDRVSHWFAACLVEFYLCTNLYTHWCGQPELEVYRLFRRWKQIGGGGDLRIPQL
jgi:hypothetical protein